MVSDFSPEATRNLPLGSIANPRGCFSVGALERYESLPLVESTLNAASVLVVRSEAYRNFPFGVRCRSAAQMSLSVLRGGGPPGAPIAPRGAPGWSLESAGRAEAELVSVSSPVFASSDSVVTVATSSDRRYTNLLSGEKMKCRGPVPCFICATAGVFEVRRPDFSSKTNWKIWSVPRFGTETKRLVALTRIEWAL